MQTQYRKTGRKIEKSESITKVEINYTTNSMMVEYDLVSTSILDLHRENENSKCRFVTLTSVF